MDETTRSPRVNYLSPSTITTACLERRSGTPGVSGTLPPGRYAGLGRVEDTPGVPLGYSLGGSDVDGGTSEGLRTLPGYSLAGCSVPASPHGRVGGLGGQSQVPATDRETRRAQPSRCLCDNGTGSASDLRRVGLFLGNDCRSNSPLTCGKTRSVPVSPHPSVPVECPTY